MAIRDRCQLQPQLSRRSLEQLGVPKVIDPLDVLLKSRSTKAFKKTTSSHRAEAWVAAVQEAIIVFNSK